MRKTAKSKLLQSFSRQPLLTKPLTYTSLVDMGLIWRLASPTSDDRDTKKRSGTDYLWRDYLDKVCSMVYSRHSNATKISSIKDDEHERRAAKHTYLMFTQKKHKNFPLLQNSNESCSNQKTKFGCRSFWSIDQKTKFGCRSFWSIDQKTKFGCRSFWSIDQKTKFGCRSFWSIDQKTKFGCRSFWSIDQKTKFGCRSFWSIDQKTKFGCRSFWSIDQKTKFGCRSFWSIDQKTKFGCRSFWSIDSKPQCTFIKLKSNTVKGMLQKISLLEVMRMFLLSSRLKLTQCF